MQKKAYDMRISDWSSDVCSSDLYRVGCRIDARDLKVVELDIEGGDVEPEPAIKQIELCADLKIIRDLRIEPNGFVGSRCLAIEAAAFEAARVAGIGKQVRAWLVLQDEFRSEEHTSELQSLMRISY